jgi:hypothetical protein
MRQLDPSEDNSLKTPHDRPQLASNAARAAL